MRGEGETGGECNRMSVIGPSPSRHCPGQHGWARILPPMTELRRRHGRLAPLSVPLPEELQRSVAVKAMFRPCQIPLLESIAEDWGVAGLGTVVWAVTTCEVERARDRYPELGAVGVSMAIAARALRLVGVDGGGAEDASSQALVSGAPSGVPRDCCCCRSGPTGGEAAGEREGPAPRDARRTSGDRRRLGRDLLVAGAGAERGVRATDGAQRSADGREARGAGEDRGRAADSGWRLTGEP